MRKYIPRNVTPASRRILLYWLLLLVPTLAVGIGAIQLLHREQERLAGREQFAVEARRAAVSARTGLIVENVELLVGDIQTGLLETVAGFPVAGIDGELILWERGNPLVRTAFRCTSDGRIVHPQGTGGEEARGFRRRFADTFASNPPWAATATAPAPASQLLRESKEAYLQDAASGEKLARQQVYSNVAQIEGARRDAKAASRAKNFPAPPAAASESVAEFRKRSEAESEPVVESEGAPSRQGWVVLSADGRPHVLGWIERARSGEVRGVELEMAGLVARLGAALPAETGADEGYALIDERGRIMHQTGWIPARNPAAAARLPLASNALRGWEVRAFLDVPAGATAEAGGFFVVGTLLVGILVVAILAGGSLLLWQARRSEAEAVQKTSFVANVSHEFKTPLTTIRLYSELLEQGRVPDEAKRRDYLQTIGRETQRLARLVGNVLDFSRLEQGRKKFEIAQLDLRAELGRLLDTQEPRLAESGLRLVRSLPDAAVGLASDRDAIGQIVLNLLDNAAKYAAGGGEVTVGLAARDGGGAVVRVMDRGAGVPPEHAERIFEKFHRVDDTLTAEQTGTGLGLSIARQLARGLGGDLTCAPREGGGAVFALELPS